ncbi:MAG: ATP-binding protein [Verrucomicrobiota bacterium]
MNEAHYLKIDLKAIEETDLQDLITHHDFVQSEMRLDQVYEVFKKNGHEYMAVVENGALLGLCSKTEIGFLLGSRFGFAVMGKKSIRDHMLPEPIYLNRSHSIREALAHVLSRTEKSFYEAVVLGDEDGTYLGIIPVPCLVHLQTALMQEKYNELEIQSKKMGESILRLENSKQRNALLFENRAIGVLFLDQEGRIVEINGKMVEMLGYTDRSFVLHQNFSQWIFEKDRGRYFRYFEETVKSKEIDFVQNQAFEFHLSDQKERFFRIQFGHIPEHREPCLFVFDVTEQHQMERAIVSKEKTAVVESLVCGIAHELNNKLSPIMGLSELMLMDSNATSHETSGLRDHLQTIYDTSKEAAIMIRQLQQLSHPTKPSYQDCDVSQLIEGMLRMVRHSLTQEGIYLKLDIPTTKTQICVDPSQMKQVFLNLILNAIHAMKNREEKRLEIQVLPSPSKVVFMIRDTGVGISEGLIDKIFDPFFTTKQGHEGSGLGLSVCQSLVQNHDGILSVSSEPGVGSVFMVTLPRVHEGRIVLPTAEVIPPLFKSDDMEFLQKKKILIVDDESDICQMVVTALQGLNSTSVHAAYNYEKAVDLMKMYRFDWVISDLRMPFYSGLDLYEWMTSNQPHLKDRFVLITGESEHSPLSKAVLEAKIQVIRKPFSIVKLLRLLKTLSSQEKVLPV